MAADTIRFVVNDRVIEARDVPPTTTLLQYLRESLGCTGTKEGCAEGDCGACMVLLGEAAASGIAYRSVNACIRLLPTVDGKSVLTVEGLKTSQGLHPAQQAMVDCHGSQCGFCTPGFVMSLVGLYLDHPGATREQAVSALAGNLCRCTGYRPILDAAVQMDACPMPAAWSRADAQSAARHDMLRSVERVGTLHLSSGAGYCAPRTLDELAKRYAAHPESLLLAGGTDVGLWVTKHMRDLPPIISLGEIAELKSIAEIDDAIEIGAAVTLSDAYAAIVARYPMLADFADRFASLPIRNSGTFCGNLANGSPIGDCMPVLIALGAKVTLLKGTNRRELPLEALYLGYQKKALEAGEFVASVRVPLPRPNTIVAGYKIAKRHDQDISAVCAGYCIEVDGGRIASARITYGGMAAIPQRASRTEAALFGQPWSESSIDAAMSQIDHDYRPISDMRATSHYRTRVAANLLKRLFLEHTSGAATTSLSVFSRAMP